MATNRVAGPVVADLWAESLARAGSALMTGEGPCMAPAIAPGTRLIVEAIPGTACQIGDVIVYRTPAGFTAHRLVGRFEWRGQIVLVHKGDNSAVWGTIPVEAVVGRVAGLPPPDGSGLLAPYYGAVARVAFAARRLVGPHGLGRQSRLVRCWYATTLILPGLVAALRLARWNVGTFTVRGSNDRRSRERI